MTIRLYLAYVFDLIGKWKSGHTSLPQLLALSAIFPIRLLKWTMLRIHRSTHGTFLSRFELIDVAIAESHLDGLWCEFGVFRGESINHIASRIHTEVYGFDSFEGIPSRWGLEFKSGAFSTAGALPIVKPNVRLVRGWFDQSIPRFLEGWKASTASFIHVDCDLYESTLVVLRNLRPLIREGTVMLFDEFCLAQPDDESRAFRQFVKETGIRFRYLGCALEGVGSVAVKVVGTMGADGSSTIDHD